MATNIEDLKNKVENEGLTEQGRLSASEFDRLVTAVMENQGSVHSVSLNNSTPVFPDENGNLNLTIALGDYEQVLTLKYNGNVLGGDDAILSADGNVVIGVQYSESEISQSGDDIHYTPTGQIVTLSVIGISTTGDQTELLSRNLASVGHGSDVFTDIDISQYLSNGKQNIQFRITNTINANPKQQQVTIVKANLELRIEDDAAWYRDAKIMNGSNASITPRYIVLGAVEKTLHILLTGVTGTRELTVEGITSSDPNTAITATFTETTNNNIGFFTTNGVREIEAWISCTYGSQSVESNHIVNHIIVVADESTAAPMIAIQGQLDIMSNYETMKIFSWNMYNPALALGEKSDVLFELANELRTTVYLSTLIEDCENNTVYEYSQNISIDASGDYIDVYVFAEVDDVPVSGSSIAYFQVDNTVDYSAVANPDFYLNPGLRSNSESNPARIINAATGEEISGCTFENISFVDGVDGWMLAEDGRRVLRVASGGRLVIPYDVYSQYVTNSRHFLTIEILGASRNVTNDDNAVLTIGNGNATNPKGLYLKPLNGAFMTGSQSTWDNADFSWQENTPTHIVVNICHNYTITNPDPTRGTTEPTTKQLSLIRNYINGVINKEYTFDPTSASEINAGGNIVISPVGCDFDIYAMRVYKDTNDKSNLEPNSVIKNKIATLPTGAERAAFKSANDILQGGLISLQKALLAGYNCIVWHGLPVNKNNSNSTKRYGKFDIYRHNADGTLDRAHSGTQYGCEMKGQGTTAMGYPEWNDQWKEDKKTGAGHDEHKYNDNGTLRNVFVDVDGNIGFGKTKFGYRLEDGDPIAKKLVGKINYASSMQSHKMGACNLYNDLYEALVTGSVTDFSNGERVTVKEEPFLFFVQRTEGSEDSLKVFQGLMTFGPGKADKPTWGVGDDDLMDGDCIYEGALNNNPLTDARVPFVDGGAVTYSVANESFMYAGEKNLNFDYGDTADLHDGQGAWSHVVQDGEEVTSEVPTTKQVKLIQPIQNFLYLMNVHLKPWDGTLDELNEAALDGDFDSASYYWMNGTGAGYNRFDLYRCHYVKVGTVISRSFVPAGIRLVQGTQTFRNFSVLYALNGETRPTQYYETDMWYDADANGDRNLTLNIKSEIESFLGITIPTSGVSSAALTSTFKQRIADIFATYVDQDLYINKSSSLFHHEIMLFWAGTDNRSKNTYYRIHPKAKPVTVVDETYYRPNIEMNDDDLDTIFKTNNSGVQSKPYYIEMQDTFVNESGQTNTYWDGQENILNNTLEATYGRALGISGSRQLELQNMMRNIFTQMASFAHSDGFSGSTIETLLHCVEMYMLRAQKYFPAVAYNETARIRYEVPAAFYSAEQPAAAPLTQSLGDQYDSEREYIKRRIIMLAGYAGYRIDSLSFRDYFGAYVANIVPHYWLYPMSRIGNPGDAPEKTNTRVPAGDTYALNVGTAVQGNTILIDFINELTDLGNIGGWGNGNYASERTLPIQIASERLRSFKCYGDSAAEVTFPLLSVQLNGSRNIEVINCRNCSTLREIPNGITSLMRLRVLDLRGTAMTSLPLPQTTTLEEVYLPDGWTSIEINRCPNLQVLTLQGYSNLTTLSIASSVAFDTLGLVQGCQVNSAPLQTLNLRSIAWTDVTSNLLNYIVNIPNVTLTGTIAMAQGSTGQINFALKKKLIELFGNVDSESNPLRITYNPVVLGGVQVSGDGYFSEVGEVKYYGIIPASASQNTILGYTWSIDAAHQDWATVDALGNVTCLQMGVEQSGSGETGTLTVVVDALDANGNTVQRTASMSIRFYVRSAKIGDYVYHDGTYDDRLNVSKDVVGICFYVNPDDPTDRRMVALRDVGSYQWGLYPAGAEASGSGFPSSGDNALRYDSNKDGVVDTSDDMPFGVPSNLLPNMSTGGYTVQQDFTDPKDGSQHTAGQSYPYVRYQTMIDPQTGDFVDYADGTAPGRGLDTLVELGQEIKDALFTDDDNITATTMEPRAFRDTCGAIIHRKNVLDGTNWTVDGVTTNGSYFSPNDANVDHLSTQILAIRNFAQNELESAYPAIYSQYLYPAMSAAYAYEPSVTGNHVLIDKFKAHNWYTPSIGELCRLAFYHLVGRADSPYKNAAVDDIFYNAVTALKFTRFAAAYYWSSTEGNSGYAWCVNFNYGGIGAGYYTKGDTLAVRPVAAF